jgi:hypothetical protein
MAVEDETDPVSAQTDLDIEADGKDIVPKQQELDDSSSDEANSETQAGVKKIEATTAVWSNTHLILAYVL